jgi:hypothetical protein
MRTMQVSSGLIATQTLTSLATLCARAEPNRTFHPRANPPPAAAEPTMKLRRESVLIFPKRIVFMAIPLCLATVGGAGREMHGLADALISAAAAHIGHRDINVVVGRVGIVLQ